MSASQYTPLHQPFPQARVKLLHPGAAQGVRWLLEQAASLLLPESPWPGGAAGPCAGPRWGKLQTLESLLQDRKHHVGEGTWCTAAGGEGLCSCNPEAQANAWFAQHWSFQQTVFLTVSWLAPFVLLLLHQGFSLRLVERILPGKSPVGLQDAIPGRVLQHPQLPRKENPWQVQPLPTLLHLSLVQGSPARS